MLEGVVDVRAEIGAFVGIVVGAELRRLRAVRPAIAAVDWAAHDEDWAAHDSDEEGDSDEESDSDEQVDSDEEADY